jgi:hypothetical protein
MTNQQILEKAIKKAELNGWSGIAIPNSFLYGYLTFPLIIFSHDFAKALWGEDRYEVGTDHNQIKVHGWKWHLKNMVVAEDPINYLGENMPEEIKPPLTDETTANSYQESAMD